MTDDQERRLKKKIQSKRYEAVIRVITCAPTLRAAKEQLINARSGFCAI